MFRNINKSLSCLLITALVLAAGCGSEKKFEYFFVEEDIATSAAVDTPSGVQSGIVPLTYTLLNADESPVNILVQYSVDNGAYWATAAMGPGGDGMIDLATSASGTAHTFMWDSMNDMVALMVQEDCVRIRITPYGKITGGPGTSDCLSVNNVISSFGNSRPIVNVSTPVGIQSGNVALTFILYDDQGDYCRILVEYVLDNGSDWLTATPGPGGDGIMFLSSGETGSIHTFVWDAIADNVAPAGGENSVRVRITPSDPYASGEPGFTDLFAVDNFMPGVPFGLKLADCSSTTILWSWNDVLFEEGYQLLDNATGAVVADDIGPDVLQVNEMGLLPNTLYSRNCRAFRDLKTVFSDNSGVAVGCTLALVPYIDNTASTFNFVNSNTISVIVSTGGNPAGTIIDLEISAGDAVGPISPFVSLGELSFGYIWNATGLASGVYYWFRARARSQVGIWTAYTSLAVKQTN
ncbi:MAG: hypothetical protein ACYS8W_04240 [Planctomycetota bacterium]|jgi:hypothetical protein